MKINRDRNGNTMSIDVTKAELDKMSDGYLIEFCNENMELLRLDVVDYLNGRLSHIFQKCNKAVARFVKRNVASLPLLLMKIQERDSGMNDVDFDSDDISFMTIALTEMIAIHNAKRHLCDGEDIAIMKYNLQKSVESLCHEKIINL